MKTILITGASRGIGAATAILAAERGYRVCINYHHNQTAAEQVAGTIRAKGGTAFLLQGDVSSEADVCRMFREVDSIGPLHALVNNVGILEKQTRVENIDAERLSRVLRSNVISCFICAREAIRRMSVKHGGAGGAIVNVSSIAARTGSPGEYVDYAASKGAMDAFTTGLSKEVADEGIRVNGVRPGFIYTDIHASGGEPGRVDRIRDTIPMKRGGQPEEVAEAILWLLSDGSSFSTGTFIDITGGR
ncbi:SDR family oxidoreductase [Chitinophaga sp. XS-30]|uniref:SDR family oxidoreductase n=1 Tax=Chitinophaga sp. XS-30 TaxID=2604421 RepID=UPI0011DDB748|nr:SDR family oxidoreductase [Chitinophaga sp. XS-30]QEH40024.1 SDR family oxidoreductase [Chitinophaga sp. XS-30]